MWFRLRYTTILLAVLTISCSSSLDGNAYFDSWPGTIYLPYIESVDLPATARMGETISITLHISSNLHPELLDGLPESLSERYLPEDVGIPAFVPNTCTQGETQVVFLPWIVNPPLSGETNDAVEFTFLLHSNKTPGPLPIRIYSAKTRELGGIKLSGSFGFTPPYNADAEYQEYTITVLPAEEAP